MSEQITPSKVLSGNAAGRAGAVALAIGSVASAGAAHATVIVNNVLQPFPATIDFDGITQFNVSGGITDAVGTNLIYTNGGSKAVKLSAGTSIGPTLFSGSTNSHSATLGEVGSKGSYYVGLDVHSGSGPGVDNYGYAQIGTDDVLSYAFETDPGLSIITPAPEPASLALLAVGVAGVLEIRRRSKRPVA